MLRIVASRPRFVSEFSNAEGASLGPPDCSGFIGWSGANAGRRYAWGVAKPLRPAVTTWALACGHEILRDPPEGRNRDQISVSGLCGARSATGHRS
jgi:hypothetical protein